MHPKAFQCILSFLALLGTVHASVSSTTECTAQAWVRAPDLTPDTIVRGDARVKISAGCPAVETVILGLRLKERSVIKALRSQEDRKQMDSARFWQSHTDFQRITPWDLPRSHFPNRSDEVTFQETLANKDLWVVREEERLVFETTQIIQMAERAPGARDVVQDFAVLVPSTNFPPAPDFMNSAFMVGNNIDSEIDIVEFMYEYFVRVPFANGTTEVLSAGLTSFQPLHDPAYTFSWPNSQTTGLEQMHMGAPRKESPVTNYTAQVSGLVFTEGSEDQVATVVITRTGPARTFTAPLTIRGCVEANFTSKWAVEYSTRGSQPLRSSGYVLRATPEDIGEVNRNRWGSSCRGNPDATVFVTLMPNSTHDEIQSGDIVTTMSAAVTVPVKVDRRQATNFETYYQTLANSLQIILGTPRSEDENVDPDDPSTEVPYTRGPEFADDEEPWVPWERKPAFEMPRPRSWATYFGSVPVVVRPLGEVTPSRRYLHAHPGVDISGQVILSKSDETGCGEQRSLTHYLDEGARGPIFVDYSALHELLAEDPAERELRAPMLEPVVSSPPEGEELVYRYYLSSRKPLIYVGKTWVKKVVNRDEHKVASGM